ncbi:MAG: peptide chain release factor N(5)-glutamine methyltransferase, partial [Actinobacteria bacterium]|nr:peptide chain release factor N(5)-glutamine methyltransferase [Actinomycetota bacterium]
MSEHITWRDVLADAAVRLSNPNEARWLCEHASGLDGAEFTAAFDEVPTTAMMASLDAMLVRRLAGEPLQYVMSRWAFRHLDLFVDKRVLIPRPETELAVEHALSLLSRTDGPARVVDLGTGSGAIGLAIASESYPRDVEVWLTDVSSDALDVARANVATLGRLGSRVKIAQGSWWSALPADLAGTLDVAVCNPPYIAVGDPEVAADVLEWEPHSALFADDDGLADLQLVIAGAP